MEIKMSGKGGKLPNTSSTLRTIPARGGGVIIDIKHRERVMIDENGNHIQIDPITRRKIIIKKNDNSK